MRHLPRDDRVELNVFGVFIDSCAVNRLALINVDPTKELAGSEFQLAVTPELEIEYRRALDHVYVPPYVKSLIRRLLERCERRVLMDKTRDADLDDVDNAELEGRGTSPPPRHCTDLHLVALAMTDLVITVDRTQIRLWGQGRPGLIPWLEIEADRSAGGQLVELLRDRARRLRHRGSC